jgi:hypothetical protein
LVIALDAIYATTSLYAHISYAWFTVPQIIFYAALAWLATVQSGTWRTGAATTFLVSIVEATLGWWVSAIIGPGRPPVENAGLLAGSALFAIALNSLVGAVSALLAERLKRKSRQ